MAMENSKKLSYGLSRGDYRKIVEATGVGYKMVEAVMNGRRKNKKVAAAAAILRQENSRILRRLRAEVA